jgi:hypothetical protein
MSSRNQHMLHLLQLKITKQYRLPCCLVPPPTKLKLRPTSSRHFPMHYWTRPLCRGPEALGKGPKALGKGFAEGGSRQRTLVKFLVGKDGLCRGPFIGHSAKPLPRANMGVVSRDGVFAEGLYLRPSAKKLSRIFFQKILCRGLQRGSRQRPTLCRGSPLAALGKENDQIFFKKILCRGLQRGPRQRMYAEIFL